MEKREMIEAGLRRALEAREYDAVIGNSPENVQHLAGVFIASQRMIPDRLAFVVYRREGAPFIVVSTVVAYTARTHSWIDEVVTYQEHATRPIDGLVQALRDHGLAKGRVLLEMGALPARDADRLRAELPGLVIDDAEQMLDRSRMVKAPAEIELMRGNIRVWEKAVRDGFMAVREDEPERDISRRLINNILTGGADWVPFTIFSTGEHTMMNHWVADASPVRRGDIMMVDMVGFFRGYYVDAARMAMIGPPNDAQRDAYARMVAAHREMIRLVRPGVAAREVWHQSVRICKELGMRIYGSDVGHSLGIRLHEYPIMNEFEEEILVEDMVMCVEISTEFEGLGRFHVEDIVRVVPGGNEVLTTLIGTAEMLRLG